MQIQMIATILILAAVLLLALSTIPVSNKIENGTLTVKFIGSGAKVCVSINK